MNAPDISINATIPLNSRDNSPKPTGNGQGLDDVATLFPGMEIFHDLRISGQGDAQLLCSIASRLNAEDVRVISLSLRNPENAQTCIKCRLSGLTSRDANDLVKSLLLEEDITSARVEHVILRAG